MTAPLLQVIDLHKKYGELTALGRVSFQVHEGEMFGLLGPNGAGKTTLLSILSCLAESTSGEVHVLGRRVSTTDREVAPADRHRSARTRGLRCLDGPGEPRLLR